MSEDNDLALEMLLAIMDGQESGIATARQLFKERKAKNYDIEKISWVPKQGDKGPYEQSDDINNHNHKELLKDLAAHKGKMAIGQFFVWTFQNGSTIGRKKRSF
jgi:hypothetical protein